jgi:hypothetical protein
MNAELLALLEGSSLHGFAAAVPTPNATATKATAPSESSFRSILITSF